MASELKQLFKRQMNEDYYYDTTSEEETTVLPLIHFGKHLRKIIRISTLEPEGTSFLKPSTFVDQRSIAQRLKNYTELYRLYVRRTHRVDCKEHPREGDGSSW